MLLIVHRQWSTVNRDKCQTAAVDHRLLTVDFIFDNDDRIQLRQRYRF